MLAEVAFHHAGVDEVVEEGCGGGFLDAIGKLNESHKFFEDLSESRVFLLRSARPALVSRPQVHTDVGTVRLVASYRSERLVRQVALPMVECS